MSIQQLANMKGEPTNMNLFAEIATGGIVGIVIGCLLAGFVGGFFAARALIKKEMQKNPPINEKMIRAMFTSMGRKPSEAQIRAVMKNVENSNK